MVTLDATAGNRSMWRHSNYEPHNWVFLDKEIQLKRPPHVLGIWDKLPFRDKAFTCVLFDPPHLAHDLKGSLHDDPSVSKGKGSWWGFFKNKRECFIQLHKAQEEFKRVTNRLCLKWNDSEISLWKILPFFKGWTQTQHLTFKSKTNVTTRTRTHWITFIHGSP